MVFTVEASKQDCVVSFMNAFALFFPGICIYLFVICFTVAIEKVASCHINLFLNAPQYKWQMVIKYTKFLCFFFLVFSLCKSEIKYF